MQHVVWLETASQDLDQILGYIEERNLLAALNLQESIEYAVSQLPFPPYLYRLGSLLPQAGEGLGMRGCAYIANLF